MRISRQLVIAFAACLMAACATTEKSPRIAGLSADAQKVVEESGAAPSTDEKTSLDASLDRYRTVTIVDEKSGKPRVICKRVRQPGTLFEKKICYTKEEWDVARQQAKENTDGIQRKMDARCPVCG